MLYLNSGHLVQKSAVGIAPFRNNFFGRIAHLFYMLSMVLGTSRITSSRLLKYFVNVGLEISALTLFMFLPKRWVNDL